MAATLRGAARDCSASPATAAAGTSVGGRCLLPGRRAQVVRPAPPLPGWPWPPAGAAQAQVQGPQSRADSPRCLGNRPRWSHTGCPPSRKGDRRRNPGADRRQAALARGARSSGFLRPAARPGPQPPARPRWTHQQQAPRPRRHCRPGLAPPPPLRGRGRAVALATRSVCAPSCSLGPAWRARRGAGRSWFRAARARLPISRCRSRWWGSSKAPLFRLRRAQPR